MSTFQTKAWEYHIPPDGADACAFRHLVLDDPVASHYNYPKPSPTIRCTVKENPDDLFTDPSRRSVAYLMTADVPICGLQLTSFSDASIIGLSIPHVTSDGHGYKEIMRALSAVLAKHDVPALELRDPFTPLAGARNAPATSGWRTYNPLQVMLLVAYFLWHLARHPVSENRDVYFPAPEVKRIKQQAMNDILKLDSGDSGEDTLWVSTSDALFAYCLKVRAHRPHNSIFLLIKPNSAFTPRPRRAPPSRCST